MSADPWTRCCAALAGEPAPALPAGRGRRHAMPPVPERDHRAEVHDFITSTKDAAMNAYIAPEPEADQLPAQQRQAAEVNNAFRALAQAALKFAAVGTKGLPDEALRVLADAAQRGARLEVRIGIPDLAAARLVLIEPEGLQHLVAEVKPRQQ